MRSKSTEKVDPPVKTWLAPLSSGPILATRTASDVVDGGYRSLDLEELCSFEGREREGRLASGDTLTSDNVPSV